MNSTFSRRTLLGAAVAATSSALPGRALAWAVQPPRAANDRGITLGVASYSMRKQPLEQALEMCKQLDVRHITLKDVHLPRTVPLESTRATVQKIRDAGLTIMGGGTISMKNNEAQLRRNFEYAKAAGFPIIVAAPEHDALDSVERLAKEFDIRIAIHNHGPEDKFFPAPGDVYARVKDRDPHMGLCIDIGHTLRAGADPVKSVLDYRDRVFDLHLKDLRSRTDRDSQVEVGKGIIDFPGLFRALQTIRFAGHAALEYEINADSPLVGMKESFAYMRGVLATLRT